MASVPGSFAYTPSVGEVLPAGVHTLTVDFTPADSAGYTTAEATVLLTVTKATPKIVWPAPAPVVHGTPLSAAQLNATASVPGRFAYTPAEGEVLATGIQTLMATFTPADTAGCTKVEASVPLTVTQAASTITWPKPASIVYGTALSAEQLNATASVPGRFAYSPREGDVLTAGVQTLSAIFTPADSESYATAQATVSLTIAKATPIITWRKPAAIEYGTALGAAQLNATASVPGKFVYIPPVGAVLAAGTHTPSVTFTPTDSADYAAVRAAVSLTVTKAASSITWPAPPAITYGTALGADQLNATASVPGKFVYTPGAGEVLAAGTQTLLATFTPTDANMPEAQASVQLTVTKATPAVKWPTPAVISYGTALGAAQLNATAQAPGSFVYSPAAGEVLAAGTHTLSVTFTPKNTADEAVTRATVSLTVVKATPIITWSTPAAIPYGSLLSAAQLNASALVPGTFVYTPAAGNVLAAGRQTLSVTFAPTDTVDYTTAQSSVSLLVEELPNIDSLMPAGIDADTDHTNMADAKEGALEGSSTPTQQGKLETRTYKGATYEKGADGQWYLQRK
jgi:hypothetical protein